MCRLKKKGIKRRDLLGILYFLRHLRMSAFLQLPYFSVMGAWRLQRKREVRLGIQLHMESNLLWIFFCFFLWIFMHPNIKSEKPTYSWIPAGRMGPAPSPSPGVTISGTTGLPTGSEPIGVQVVALPPHENEGPPFGFHQIFLNLENYFTRIEYK